MHQAIKTRGDGSTHLRLHDDAKYQSYSYSHIQILLPQPLHTSRSPATPTRTSTRYTLRQYGTLGETRSSRLFRRFFPVVEKIMLRLFVVWEKLRLPRKEDKNAPPFNFFNPHLAIYELIDVRHYHWSLYVHQGKGRRRISGYGEIEFGKIGPK